jgi:hypothetical protein
MTVQPAACELRSISLQKLQRKSEAAINRRGLFFVRDQSNVSEKG